jgi:hypothetical protein
MKRVIIVCEGSTEQEFCNKTLTAYFAPKGIYIDSPLIKKSNGGIVHWTSLKKQIENHLNQELSAHVSLLIDYYMITDTHDFPGWIKAKTIADKNKRLTFLEQEMKNDIDESLRYRFIPYLQLHEFECLLFNNIDVFRQQFTVSELVGMKELKNTLESYPNPEMINDTPDNSPSHRLGRIIKGYNKIVYGNCLAETIGLSNIRNKCPRFNAWINSIETLE